MVSEASVVVATHRFADDLDELTGEHGFRIESIFPADAPTTAVVSAGGVRLRLEAVSGCGTGPASAPVRIRVVGTDATAAPHAVHLPGGTVIEVHPPVTGSGFVVPEARPTLTISHDADGDRAPGRAGMVYRDLLPDRWGGRFVASHISIPDGGPVGDYVHFHRLRFQVLAVQHGWVRVAYEDQGEPIVMRAGDVVLQPPGIRHRVLESSPALSVIELACPAVHETVADWELPLPNGVGPVEREWSGQRFVHHVADGAPWSPAPGVDGWELRDSGVGAATGGLGGVRFLRPVAGGGGERGGARTAAAELTLLAVMAGSVTFECDAERTELRPCSAVAIPPGTPYRLMAPSSDCELLEVALPG